MNYTFRMHDPRVGRFLSNDPLAKDFPWNSPYSFSENDVNSHAELEGGEKTDAISKAFVPAIPVVTTIGKDAVKELANQQLKNAMIEEGGQKILKKQASKGVGEKVLGTVGKGVGLVFTLFRDYMSPNYGGRTSEIIPEVKPLSPSKNPGNFFAPSPSPLPKPDPAPIPGLPKNPEKDKYKPKINLDTGTVRAMMDGSTPLIEAAVTGKKLLVTSTAYGEALDYATRSERLVELHLLMVLRGIEIIPDNPSERAMNLQTTKKVGSNDKIIFGTGDKLNIQTITSDAKFVSGASAQGVDFNVFVHPPK